MSRSRLTQLPLVLPATPRPIPRVELAQEPPAGTRWLGIGELIEATDQYVHARGHGDVWSKIVGHRMHQLDLGHYARKI